MNGKSAQDYNHSTKTLKFRQSATCFDLPNSQPYALCLKCTHLKFTYVKKNSPTASVFYVELMCSLTMTLTGSKIVGV
jgi:hypothetical protein